LLIDLTAQNVLLYQRLTKAIAKLTGGVEADLQRWMDDVNNLARQSNESLGQLPLHINRLKDDLERVQDHLSGAVHGSLRQAQNLKRLLDVLVANAVEGHSELASAHEQSLQRVSQSADNEIATLAAVIVKVLDSSVSLQTQIVSLPPQPV
jgi:conjugal transfer/entry exclusion protein